MRSLLLLSEDAGTAAYVRSVLAISAQSATVDVCTTPVQLRHRLSTDPSCLTVAIDEMAIGNALIPFVRHLRAERQGLSIVLLTGVSNDEAAARGALAGVDLVSARDERGLAEWSALLAGRNGRQEASAPPPFRLLAWSASRQMLATMGKSQRLRTSAVSAEQMLADPQLPQSADAIVLVATPPDEAAVLLFRLRTRAAAVPLIVVCDEQGRDGFLRLGAAECLPPGSGPEQIESAVTRVVEQARLRSEATLLRNKEQRLRSIVESLPEGVVLTDPDGIVQAINHAAVDLCHAGSAQAVLGQRLSALFGAHNEAALGHLVNEVVAGRPANTAIVTEHEGVQSQFGLRAVPFAREATLPPFVLLAVGAGHVISSSNNGTPDINGSDSPPEELERERASRLSAEQIVHEIETEKGQLRDELTSTLGRLTVAEALAARLQDEREEDSRRVAELERERERLREEKAQVETLLAGHTQQHGAALAAQHSLEQERDAHSRQLDDRDHERQALQRGLAAAQWEVAELLAAREARDTDLAAHAQAVAELERTCDELRTQHTASEERVSALAQAGDALRADRNALQRRLADLEQERDTQRHQPDDAAHERQALQEALAAAQRQVTELAAVQQAREADREAHVQAVAVLEHTCGELRTQHTASEEQVAALSQTGNALRAEGDTLQRRLADLEQERDAQRRQLDDAVHERQSLQEALAAAQRQVTALAVAQEAREAEREAHTQVVEALERACDDLRAQHTASEEQVATLSQTGNALRAEGDTVQRRLAGLEQERDAQRRQFVDAERDRHDLQQALAAAQQRATELPLVQQARDADREAHAQAVAALERACDELRAQYTASEERVNALSRASDALRVEGGTLQQRLAELEQERDAQRRQQDEAAHERQSLQEALAAAQRQVTALAALQEAHEAEREAHTQVVATLERACDELRAQLTTSEERVSALSHASDALRAEGDTLQRRLAELEQERDAQRRQLDVAAHERQSLEEARAAAQQQATEFAAVQEAREADRVAHAQAAAVLERACDELRARNTTGEERVVALAYAGDVLQQRVADLEHERAELADELRSLRVYVTGLSEVQRAYDDERASREGLLAELEDGRQALDAARREADLAQATVTKCEEERWAALALAEARAQALDVTSHEMASLHEQQALADQEFEVLRAAQAEAAATHSRLEAELSRQHEQLLLALQELEPLRKAHAAACAGYITGKRSLATLEQERDALRTQLEESRAMTAHAMAEAERARLSREDWERRAGAALGRQAAEDVLMRQRADALLHRGPAGELDWLLGVATIGVMSTALDGRLERINSAAATVCGWADVASAIAHGRVPDALLALSDSSRGTQSLRFETWVEGCDGILRWVLGVATISKLVASDSTHMEWMLVDLSHQHLDGRAASNSRVEALPHLLSAAASECTTMLEQVGQMMERNAPGGTEVPADHLAATQRGLRRTRLVLEQIGSPAHAGTRRPVVVDLADALTHATPLVAKLVGDDIVSHITPPVTDLLLAADRTDVEQLLIALALAGRECLPRGGHLTLSGSSVTAEADHDGETVSRPSVVIRVNASGHGAQPVVWHQATDLAARLGGWVETRHEAAGGSTIEVVLPRAIRLNGVAPKQDRTLQPQDADDATQPVRATRAGRHVRVNSW